MKETIKKVKRFLGLKTEIDYFVFKIDNNSDEAQVFTIFGRTYLENYTCDKKVTITEIGDTGLSQILKSIEKNPFKIYRIRVSSSIENLVGQRIMYFTKHKYNGIVNAMGEVVRYIEREDFGCNEDIIDIYDFKKKISSDKGLLFKIQPKTHMFVSVGRKVVDRF